MTPEKALELLNRIEQDNFGAQNVVAQGSARYVLFSVQEPWANIREINFRPNLDAALDNLAFLYLTIGCCLLENKIEQYRAVEALQKGARLLEFSHLYEANQRFHSHYCLLVAALGYYAASQYSKAFILLKRAEEYEMPIGRLASLFLKKELTLLTDALTEILANEDYIGSKPEEAEERIHVLLFARACAHALEYLHAGETANLDTAIETLNDLQTLLLADMEPSGWWVARLFSIIVDGFRESSLWATIPPLFPPDSNIWASPDLGRFIKGLIFREKPVTELFVSQRQALPKALDPRGAVLSLPTSSGKTRIAEIAIFHCLVNDPFAKALYLVPTRSLALEVENELDDSLGQLGFVVSLLYGGSGLTGMDRSAIEQSRILIATTEKAKAILRANESLAAQIRLLIFDEGHLLGANERYIRSELFIEEMRLHLKRNGGKILSLSAVLPNVGEIANWIAGDAGQAEKCDWRPSRQRLGWLIYQNNNNVRIEWMPENGVNSFNERFIEGAANKHKAIVAAAIKLSTSEFSQTPNCVLVFAGSKPSVLKYARTAAELLNQTSQAHEWRYKEDWHIFELACREFYGDNSDLLDWAKVGVICHHGKLPTDVRFAMERLMRKDYPRIIVATTTLAEGVNLGISSVIFTSKYIASAEGNKPISNSKFWNIAGRAGRAFTDIEGKILYFIDQKANASKSSDEKQNSQNDYFKPALEPAESGVLMCMKYLKIIASNSGVNFELLLQLVAENNLSLLGENEAEASEIFDLVDDTLLAIDIAHTEEGQSEPTKDWLDDHFRASLAYLQAKQQTGFPAEDVIRFLKARFRHIRQASGDLENRRRLAASSLPWRSAMTMQGLYLEALALIKTFLNSYETLDDRLTLLENIESLFKRLPSKEFQNNVLSDDKLSIVRKAWLSGEAVGEDSLKAISEHFTYKIPWALNALSQQLASEHPEEAKVLEYLALCCEVGLPNEFSTGIYLAGIRSRAASVELSGKIDQQVFELNSSKAVKEWIIEQREWLFEELSSRTKQWIELLVQNQHKQISFDNTALPMRSFQLDQITAKSDRLYLRRMDGKWLLCSADFTEKVPLPRELEIPEGLSGHIKIGFARTEKGWKMFDRSKSN